MTDSTLALLVFLFPLAFSPGPGNLFFAALGARGPLREAAAPMAGYHMATWAVTVAMGLGAFGMVQVLPGLTRWLGYAGAGYLLFLAAGLLRAGPGSGLNSPDRAGIGTGAALLLLNPKAYVIIALMFAQFAEAAGSPGGVVWIATVFTLNNLAAFALWTVLGERLAAICGAGRCG
ncbi:LysE family translocator [Meridianimarinicoccus roseus]|uniref:LysE family translocator n=1 Tax=Meridianimarinicoccus roseus TaxID=2072018 RepID=UPI001EE680D2|nr:LysE family transporter [Meridianimarinicoccus roseus]